MKCEVILLWKEIRQNYRKLVFVAILDLSKVVQFQFSLFQAVTTTVQCKMIGNTYNRLKPTHRDN